MKNITLIILSVFLLVSCGEKKETKKYQVAPETSTVKWTAYKMTEKVPVSGKFQKINITKSELATSVIDAVNGTEFSIPVNSIFTENADRDAKLKEFFFGVMNSTQEIKGTLELQDKGVGNVKIAMNGVVAKLPITYKVADQLVTITGTMDLNLWNAKAAVESLNKVCLDLHKGADGVSKTWEEVKVEAAVYVKFLKK